MIGRRFLLDKEGYRLRDSSVCWLSKPCENNRIKSDLRDALALLSVGKLRWCIHLPSGSIWISWFLTAIPCKYSVIIFVYTVYSYLHCSMQYWTLQSAKKPNFQAFGKDMINCLKLYQIEYTTCTCDFTRFRNQNCNFNFKKLDLSITQGKDTIY